ncbi:hypothetical protein TNCV_5083621 [Trichonephila clavipes]|uniref:Uncharacterized protein n=1 Tax=Trichonephila clavipes TaxID=2585209 RepID=A0A8X6S8P2_TRICX|nr:hypothetical protein TNCV_5083621 [Trichonephila clavipes]
MAPCWARCIGVLCANRTRRPRETFCDMPIRRDEGVFVDPPLVFKRVFFRRREWSPAWMEKKEKSPALDRESMRGEPWLERTEESAKERVLVRDWSG